MKATGARALLTAEVLAMLAARTFVPMTESDFMSFGGAEFDSALISHGTDDDDSVVIVHGSTVTVVPSADNDPLADSQEFVFEVRS